MNHFKAAVFLCGYGGSREVMLCRFAGRLTHETIIRKPAIPTPSPIGQSVSERCLGRQKRPAGVPFGNACRAGVGYSESSSSVISSRDRTMRVGVTGPRSASSRVASPVSTRMEVASVPWARAMSVYSLSPTTASSAGAKPVFSVRKSRVCREGLP